MGLCLRSMVVVVLVRVVMEVAVWMTTGAIRA